jgi:hypothetical protein
MTSVDLTNIPRGNTSPGVNREIIKYLLSLGEEFTDDHLLDVPCGEGYFLQAVKDFFPNIKTVGADLNPPSTVFPHQFQPINAQHNFSLETRQKFRVITCISGVMEFSNTLSFFEELKRNLGEDGWLIVTNDNLLSVRDRFSYLFFGRFRQYPLLFQNYQPTWKITPLQNLFRVLAESGFETVEIKYVAPKKAEWLWLPLALPIYIFQYLHLRFNSQEIPLSEKLQRYPFLSLLSRHYIVICRLKRQDRGGRAIESG